MLNADWITATFKAGDGCRLLQVYALNYINIIQIQLCSNENALHRSSWTPHTESILILISFAQFAPEPTQAWSSLFSLGSSGVSMSFGFAGVGA